MKSFGSSLAMQLGVTLALGVLGPLGGCSSASSSDPAVQSSSTKSGSKADASTKGSSGSGSGTSSGSSSDDDSSGASSGGTEVSSDDAGNASGDAAVPSDAASTSDAAASPDAQPACVKGQTPTNEVIVLGDSYLDHPAWSNAIPDLYADLRASGSLGATATYREYQLGGASMNYGTFNLNIPYQYETTAKGDIAFMNPKNIDTIIMDGGGNDVLIDNQDCMTNAMPPPGNASCATAIQGTIDRANKLLKEAASDGVKHIVYVFYPHLDPAGGGLLPTPAPQVNATLDYAYPLAEQLCCGSSFTSSLTSYTCSGNTTGAQCVFVDTRPAFEGHIADYIKSDHVHPTDAGAKVIADLIAGAMSQYCIAQ